MKRKAPGADEPFDEQKQIEAIKAKVKEDKALLERITENPRLFQDFVHVEMDKDSRAHIRYKKRATHENAVKWTYIEPATTKWSHKHYTSLNQGMFQIEVSVVTEDLKPVLEVFFKAEIEDSDIYQMDQFIKKLQKVMMDYPFEGAQKYGQYLDYICTFLKEKGIDPKKLDRAVNTLISRKIDSGFYKDPMPGQRALAFLMDWAIPKLNSVRKDLYKEAEKVTDPAYVPSLDILNKFRYIPPPSTDGI